MYSGGSGTNLDPYILSNATDVNDIRYNMSAYYSIQSSNIDLSSLGDFIPIGYQAGTTPCPFTGHIKNGVSPPLDPATLSNLTINMPTEDYVGFICIFDSVETTLGTGDWRITFADVTGHNYVGAFCGKIISATTSIDTLVIAQTINISGNDYVGGFCGLNQSPYALIPVVSGDMTSAFISGNDYVGGLAGKNEGILSGTGGCNVSGNNYVGGLVGHNSGTFTSGSLASKSRCIVNGVNYVGGAIGYSNKVVSNIYMDMLQTATITGNDCVGGIVGYLDRCYFKQLYVYNEDSTGIVTGNDYVGGFVGYLNYDAVDYTTPCINLLCQLNVSGRDCVGGFVGIANNGYDLSDSDTVNLYGSDEIILELEISGRNYVGGIIGRGDADISTINIDNCLSKSYQITGSSYVGGVAGKFTSNASANISNSGSGAILINRTNGSTDTNFGRVSGTAYLGANAETNKAETVMELVFL